MYVYTTLRRYVATSSRRNGCRHLTDASDRWQTVACPSILSALPSAHDGGFTTVVVVAIGVARQPLCASTLCNVCDRSTHGHTRHAHTTTTHTYTQCVTHAEPWPRRPTTKVWHTSACHRTLGILVVPHTYGSPLCCGATDMRAPPGDVTCTPSTESWSRSSVTQHQPCEPLPSTGCAVSTCPDFSARSTREIPYSGNGPPEE